MTAFNAVRFRVKPGRDEEFLDAHKKIKADWPGLQRVNMIKTGTAAIASSPNGATWTRSPRRGQT